MHGYIVEWIDATGTPDALLTCFCTTRTEAYRLAHNPPAHWYYWGKRPTILPIAAPRPGGARRAAETPDASDASLRESEEAIQREYGVWITEQLNGRYTVASQRESCPPQTNLTIYAVAAAIRAVQAADRGSPES